MTSPGGGPFRIDVIVDTRQAQQALNHLRQESQRAAQQADQLRSAFSKPITVTANAAQVDRELKQVAQQAARLQQQAVRINVTASAANAHAAMQALQQTIRQAEQRGARVTVHLDVAKAERDLQAFQRRAQAQGRRTPGGGSAGGGSDFEQLTSAIVGGNLAANTITTAISALERAFKASVQAGIDFNSQIQTADATLRVFTGSTTTASVAVDRLRKIAREDPLFNTREVIAAGQAFILTTRGSVAEMEKLVKLSTQLAAVNPDPGQGGGLGGATVALREALSGDFQSIVERFRVSRADVERIKELGLSGTALAEALVRAAGGSEALSKALADTLPARIETVKSRLEELAGVATKPAFDQLNAGLGAVNKSLEEHAGWWERVARAIGEAAAATAKAPPFLVGVGPSANIAGRAFGRGFAQQPAAERELSAGDRARQASIDAAKKAVDEQNAALARQDQILQTITRELARTNREAQILRATYEAQTLPLRNQLAEINRPNFDLQRQRVDLDERQLALDRTRADAQPPVALRAEVAAIEVMLGRERELTSIRHRRQEISEQIANAEQAIADRATERQLAAAELGIRAMRDQAQAASEARQQQIEGLREQIEAQQQARSDALEGFREQIEGQREKRQVALDAQREEQAAQRELRGDALDSIREQIRARREAVSNAREAFQEQAAAAEAAFRREAEAADRANQARQEALRGQIDALREQDRLASRRERGPTPSEQALSQLDQAERERSRIKSLADAEKAIAEARTGRARREAIERRDELRRELAVQRQREALEAKARQEREARERAAEARQENIRQLEVKAREEDRRFQKQRQAEEDQFRVQQEAQRQAERAEEKAERQRQRAEDQQVRALEAANREADRAAQREFQAAEKAARDADRIAQAALRAEEKADREQTRIEQQRLRDLEKAAKVADKADQDRIRAEERRLEDARRAFQEGQAARQEALAQNALIRLRETAALEAVSLTNRERLILAEDTAALAWAAREQAILDAAKQAYDFAVKRDDLDKAKASIPINETIDALEAEFRRLDEPLRIRASYLEAEKLAMDRLIELEKIRRDELQKTLDQIVKGPERFPGGAVPGETPISPGEFKEKASLAEWLFGEGSRIDNIKQWAVDAAGWLAEGMAQGLASTAAKIDAATRGWVNEGILGPANNELGIASPSTKFAEMAYWNAQGYILQADHQAPFVRDSILEPFRQALDEMRALDEQFGEAARRQAEAWKKQFMLAGIPAFARGEVWLAVVRLNELNTSFGIAGQNAAYSWQRAWREAFRGFDCDPCAGKNRQPQPPTQPRNPLAGGPNSRQPRPEALGGYVMQGMPYLVGERGPELFTPERPGAIIPNSTLNSPSFAGFGGGSGGGRPISVHNVFNISGTSDPRAVADIVLSQVADVVIDVLDFGQRTAPTPASRILSGAV